MRQLNTGDAFKVLQIFRAAGLKDEFAELINCVYGKGKKNVEEIGGRLFAMIFNCLGHEKAEPPIVDLLASIAETDPEKIVQQPIPDTIALLKDIATQNDMKSFFEGAASLTK